MAKITGIDDEDSSTEGRSHGGKVVEGTPYTVGERGRELYVPDVYDPHQHLKHLEAPSGNGIHPFTRPPNKVIIHNFKGGKVTRKEYINAEGGHVTEVTIHPREDEDLF